MPNTTFNFANLSRYTLSADINASTTSVGLTSVGSPPGVPFRALIHDQKFPNPVDDSSAEFVTVTVAGASPWTVTRGAEGSAFAHTGSTFYLTPCLTAEFANLLGNVVNTDATIGQWVKFVGAAQTYSVGQDEVTDKLNISNGADPATNIKFQIEPGTTTSFNNDVFFDNTVGSGAATLTLGPSGPSIQMGTGTPESVVSAEPGSLYLNLTGGAGVSLYVKESGSSNTGWVAK